VLYPGLTQAAQPGELTTSYIPPAPIPLGPFSALPIEIGQIAIAWIVQTPHAGFTPPGDFIAVSFLASNQGQAQDYKSDLKI